MSQPNARAVHVDQPLTNISIAFLQNATNFVAGQVFPNLPVAKQSDLYYTFDRGYFNRDEAKKRAPGTEAAKVGFELDTASYFADVWAVKHGIPDQIAANADAVLNLERAAAELVTHKLLIRQEKDWAANFFTTGLWGTDVTGAASSPGTGEVIQWSDQTSGDPIANIRSAKTDMMESTGFMPNTLVMSQRVLDALVDHPDIVDRIKYSGGVGPNNPAVTSEQALAQLFGVPRILVMRGIENTAAEGDANVHSFIGGKNALLCYAAPTPGLMTPSAGYKFSWQGYLGQTNTFGMATKRRYRDELETTEIEGSMAMDHRLVASELGHFFSNIVS
ncbi:MAG TPA: hypothetical protein VIG24_02795 [Acidimicrobiia bacterium]